MSCRQQCATVRKGRAKAAEGRRTPGRFAPAGPLRSRASVLECASPLALFPRIPARLMSSHVNSAR